MSNGFSKLNKRKLYFQKLTTCVVRNISYARSNFNKYDNSNKRTYSHSGVLANYEPYSQLEYFFVICIYRSTFKKDFNMIMKAES